MPAPKRALEGVVPGVGPIRRAGQAAPLVLGPAEHLVEAAESSEHLALAAAALSQSYDEYAKVRRALSKARQELLRCPPDAMRDATARIDALRERLATLELLGHRWAARDPSRVGARSLSSRRASALT